MAVRRTLALGTLHVQGTAFTFKAASPLAFEANVGDEVNLGVTYNYDDTSPQKNAGRIVLTIDLGGAQHAAEVKIRDLPGVDDRDRQFIGRVLSVPAAGDVYGRFRIEADLEESTWTGSARAKSKFLEEGTFLVRVQ